MLKPFLTTIRITAVSVMSSGKVYARHFRRPGYAQYEGPRGSARHFGQVMTVSG